MTDTLFDPEADLVGLIPVCDLIGRHVEGKRARVDNRPDDDKRGPLWRTLKRVERRMERADGAYPEPWVYWMWEREGTWQDEPCGYSGMTFYEAVRSGRCLEFAP